MTDAPSTVNSIVTAPPPGQNVDMKPPFTLAVAALALTGCAAPLSIYYRPGAAVTRMQTDETHCAVKALKDAPVANQVRQYPPVWFPGTQYCNSNGCYYSPGYWVDGGFYTVDVNRPLRERVQTLCMAEKGYQPVTLPRCSTAVAKAAPPAQTTTLPRLTQESCAISYKGGGWQIVTPAAATASE